MVHKPFRILATLLVLVLLLASPALAREADPTAYAPPFAWRGHSLRAVVCSEEAALAGVGLPSPAIGTLIMLRYACDGVPVSLLWEHLGAFSMRDASGAMLDDNPALRVNGVVMEDILVTDAPCDAFDLIFYLEDWELETRTALTFCVQADEGEVALPIAQIPAGEYAVLEDDADGAPRDFAWTLAHMAGKVDAFSLFYAVCQAGTEPADAYRDARAYAQAHGMADAFAYIQEEIAAHKLLGLPTPEMQAHMEEYFIEWKTSQQVGYRRKLIDELIASDELLSLIADPDAQFSYRGALWDGTAFEHFYGADMANFTPLRPRPGVYLLTVADSSQGKPEELFDPANAEHADNVRNYAQDIAHNLYTLFGAEDFLLTGNPQIASVRIEADMQYISAGSYANAAGGTAHAYNCALTLTAYDMRTHEAIGTLTARREYDATIHTSSLGTIWCDSPDLTVAEQADAFVRAVTTGEAPPAKAEVEAAPVSEVEAHVEPGASDAPGASLGIAIAEALGDSLYRDICNYLAQGSLIAKGDVSEYAKGLQAVLSALGRNISVDGAAGAKTFAALNEVQRGLRMEETQAVDAACFARLLTCLVSVQDEEAAAKLLAGAGMSGAERAYLGACGAELTGRYGAAYEAFSLIDWEDSKERAEACVQAWPKNGEVYRNGAYGGRKTNLRIKIDRQDGDRATLAKIYAENGDLVSCLFTGGPGTVTTKLPGGTYTIRIGAGVQWFGVHDAFGRMGSYQTLLFDGGETQTTLKSGFEYALTINTSSSDPNADGVGFEHADWNGF